MIDKYKPARVQRLVPWRGAAPAPQSLARQRVNVIIAHIRQSEAAHRALVSGAMPRDLQPKELRGDWQ